MGSTDEKNETIKAPPPPPIATMHVVMWLAFENPLRTWNPAASLGFPLPANVGGSASGVRDPDYRRLTAMKEATYPAGAPLCGFARITVPTSAGT
jgi:hypothetical protein